jgi:hypothetical protein
MLPRLGAFGSTSFIAASVTEFVQTNKGALIA